MKVFLEGKNQTIDIPDGTDAAEVDRIARSQYSPEEVASLTAKPTTFAERTKSRWDMGVASTQAGRASWDAMIGKVSPETAKQLRDDFNKKYGADFREKMKPEGLPEAMVGMSAELAPYMMDSAVRRQIYGNTMGLAAGGMAMASGVGATVAVPMALAGNNIGQAYGTWQSAAEVEGGLLYGSMVDDGVDHNTAMAFAVPAGYLIGAIEIFQIDHVVGKRVPGFAREMFTKTIKNWAKAKMNDGFAKGTAKFLAKMATRQAASTLVETGQEVVQDTIGFVSEAMAYFVDAVNKEEEYRGKDMGDLPGELLETIKSSLLGFPLINTPGSVFTTMADTNIDKRNHIIQTAQSKASLLTTLAPKVEEASKFNTLKEYENAQLLKEFDKGKIEEMGFDNYRSMLESIWAESRAALDNMASESEVTAEAEAMQTVTYDLAQDVDEATANAEPKEIQKIRKLSKEIGVRIGKIEIADQEKWVDVSTPEGVANAVRALKETGQSEETIRQVLSGEKGVRLNGEHYSYIDNASGQKWSGIRTYKGAGNDTIYHEFAHAVDEQGGLPGWQGTKEQRADFIAEALLNNRESEILELTPEGSRIKSEADVVMDLMSKPGNEKTLALLEQLGDDTQLQIRELAEDPPSDVQYQIRVSPLGFYSQAEKTIEQKVTGKMSGEQLAKTLRNAGVKVEELDNLALEMVDGKLTKDEWLTYVRANAVPLEEKVLGGEVDPALRATANDVVFKELPRGEHDRYRVYDVIVKGERLTDTTSPTLAEPDMSQSRKQYYADLYNQNLLPAHPKFSTSNLNLPGGSNYREILLKLPQTEKTTQDVATELFNKDWIDLTLEERNQAVEKMREYDMSKKDFRESHWDDPNVLAHARAKDRTTLDGDTVLAAEEVQSDWHQKGREKGYQIPYSLDPDVTEYLLLNNRDDGLEGKEFERYEELTDILMDRYDVEGADTLTEKLIDISNMQKTGVPNAPFKKTWELLMLKRLIGIAVKEGKNAVAWTTGKVQAERYKLSKQVDKILWNTLSANQITIGVTVKGEGRSPSFYTDKSGVITHSWEAGNNVVGKNISEVLGKSIAEKILSEKKGALEGVNLDIGGDGMKGFYDKKLPNAVNDYVKKWGTRVGKRLLVLTETGFEDRIYKGRDYTLEEVKALAEKPWDNDRIKTQLMKVVYAMEMGMSFHGVASQYISPATAKEAFGGEIVTEKEIGTEEFWYLPITPEMRESVTAEGQPQYQIRIEPIKESQFEKELKKALQYKADSDQISMWEAIYAQAKPISLSAMWKYSPPDAKGKLAGVPVVNLTNNCNRATFIRIAKDLGFLDKDYPEVSCYASPGTSGACYKDRITNMFMRPLSPLKVGMEAVLAKSIAEKQIEVAKPENIRALLSNKSQADIIRKAQFVRLGQAGDDSHAVYLGLVEEFLRTAQELGVKPINKYVFVTSSYAPTDIEMYKRLKPYKDMFVIHVSQSGYFSQMEAINRFSEYFKILNAGLDVRMRVITNASKITSAEEKALVDITEPMLTPNEGFILGVIHHYGLNNFILETPFHNDALGSKTGRSAPEGISKAVCCSTGRCSTCPALCMVKSPGKQKIVNPGNLYQIKVEDVKSPKTQKAVVQGAINAMVDEADNILKQMDKLERLRKRMVKTGLPVDEIVLAEKELARQYDVKDSEIAEILTANAGVTIESDIRMKARELMKLERQVWAESAKEAIRETKAEEREVAKQAVKAKQEQMRQKTEARDKVVLELQESLISYAKNRLSGADRGKMLDAVKNVRTPEQLLKAVKRMNKIAEDGMKRGWLKQIKSLLRMVKRSKTISIDYVQKVADFIDSYELQGHTGKTMNALRATKAWIEQQEKLGIDVEMPKRVFDALRILERKPLEEMTPAEMRDLYERIKVMALAGKTKFKAKKFADKLMKSNDLAAIKRDAKKIESAKIKRGNAISGQLTAVDKFVNTVKSAWEEVRRIDISLTPIDVLFDLLDGFKNYNGANYRIFKSRVDSAYREYLNERYRINAKAAELAEELKLDQDDMEWIGVYAAKVQEGGEEKLLTMFTQAEIDKVVLNDNQAKFYYWMRGELDALRPRIAEIMEKVYNQPLGKVTNYFPFLTDFDAMTDAEIRERFGDKVATIDMSLKKNVEMGATIERKGGKNQIKINAAEVFGNHIDNALYLIHVGTHTKYLGELAAMAEYGEAVGDVAQKAVRDWIDLLARKGITQGNRIKVLDALRGYTGLMAMGLKLSSVTIQITALMDGAALIGADAFRGFGNVIRSAKWRKFLSDNMPGYRERIGDDPAFADFTKDTFIKKVANSAYFGIKVVDKLAAGGVAAGAYIQYVEKNGGEVNLDKVDPEAVAFAEKIMRRTQSSGAFKDAPSALSRGGLTGNTSLDKALLQFQSFLLNRWSLIRHDMWRAGILTNDKLKAVNIFMWLLLANIAENQIRTLSRSMVYALAGADLPEEDGEDKENLRVFRQLIGNVPFMGSIFDAMKYDGVSIAPSFSKPGELFFELGKAFLTEINEDKEEGQKQVQWMKFWASVIPGGGQFKSAIKVEE